MIRPKLQDYVARLFPGAKLIAIEPLAPDSGATAGSTAKVAGYGKPVRLVIDDAGQRRDLVWRVAGTNEFGHDRRADRAAETLLAYDDFPAMPSHIGAIDVGAIRGDGELVSLRDAGELYLLTTYAAGTIYAEDLRRLASGSPLTDLDVQRLDALADYLADLHVPIPGGQTRYRRAIRDLVGHGEGIYGIVDGYSDDVPAAPPHRLYAIEERCAAWRERLRDRGARLARTHGDFHPFNIVFDRIAPTLLDASRGACGDPADDVTALAINFVLFAIDARPTWRDALGVLWRRWWGRARELRPDPELLDVAPPFFAWRALVVCNPRFYPALSSRGRDALLGLAEQVLDSEHLDPQAAEALFT
ncbi:MAG TPA: phosphotransferase [Kofleriaceae bacterium]|nr:phosphotransferase [Kofleriaceae bacterium]